MSAVRIPIEHTGIIAECRPSVVVAGGVLEIGARFTGGMARSGLQFRILDEKSQARFYRLDTVSRRRRYHVPCFPEPSQRIGPGHYQIAISAPGQQGAALASVTVIDRQAESRANLQREALDASAAAGERLAIAKLENGQIGGATRMIEIDVSLYNEIGADAPAWQATVELGRLYLDQNHLESAKRVTLRARKLLRRLDYPLKHCSVAKTNSHE